MTSALQDAKEFHRSGFRVRVLQHAFRNDNIPVIPGRRVSAGPGIQKQVLSLYLDSGSGPFGPSRNDQGKFARTPE